MTQFEEPKRFWSKVDVGEADECWEWLAYKNNKVVGRVAGIINNAYIDKWENKYTNNDPCDRFHNTKY